MSEWYGPIMAIHENNGGLYKNVVRNPSSDRETGRSVGEGNRSGRAESIDGYGVHIDTPRWVETGP